MKVSITKESKECIFASQLSTAKAVCESLKDEESAKWYAEMAARLLLDDNSVTVFCASAHVMRNARAWNRFATSEENDSGDLDVWIDFSAKSWDQFIEGGCYLSDLWDLYEDNKGEIKSHMFCIRYTR